MPPISTAKVAPRQSAYHLDSESACDVWPCAFFRGTAVDRCGRLWRIILKVVVLILFLAAFYVSILWHSGAERGLTPAQQSATGFAAILGWILTFALASMA